MGLFFFPQKIQKCRITVPKAQRAWQPTRLISRLQGKCQQGTACHIRGPRGQAMHRLCCTETHGDFGCNLMVARAGPAQEHQRRKMTDTGCPEPRTALIILQMHREGQRRSPCGPIFSHRLAQILLLLKPSSGGIHQCPFSNSKNTLQRRKVIFFYLNSCGILLRLFLYF
nr:uncharacterized protein LOC112928073 isoform X2 [Vulpes vulpes]